MEYKSTSNRKSQLQSGLAALHSKMEKEEITTIFISQEKELNLNILNATRCEEEELRVKSRQLWLKGGDSNTDYFHKQSKARIFFNIVKELKGKDGKRMVDQEEIKDHVFQHFRDLYMDKEETDPLVQTDLLFGIPSLITEKDDKDLSKPIMEFEIKDVIWSLQADKAPGPDGFTINFYKAA